MLWSLLITSALAQDAPRGWQGAVRVSQISLGLLAASTVADVSVGAVQFIRGSSTPTLDALHTASAASLASGIGGLSVGGLLGAGALRAEGMTCPTGAGIAALGLEAVGLGLILADPVLSMGRAPLPWWVDWVKLGALPFALLQIDAAERRAQRGLLIGWQIAPGGLSVVGRF